MRITGRGLTIGASGVVLGLELLNSCSGGSTTSQPGLEMAQAGPESATYSGLPATFYTETGRVAILNEAPPLRLEADQVVALGQLTLPETSLVI